MGRVRKVLGTCTIETAQRAQVCHRDRKKHAIEKGTPCLVIKDPASGCSKNYHPECALAILDQASDDLRALRGQLS